MIYLGEVKNNILKARYLYTGENEDDMWKRVAKHIANGNEDLEHNFYNMMSDGLFIPNTPTLMNAGNEIGYLSACNVLGIEDSIDSIYKTLYETAVLFKSGSGVGFNFSNIRPSGSVVGSTNGVASGVLSFMSLFDNTCEVIKQGGKRRGAMMGMLDIEHPEIEQFIDAKREEGVLSNFNISVNVDDAFMEHCEKHDLWKKIVHNAWENGEPGLFFRNMMNRDNPFDTEINCTNPCVTGDTLVLTDYGYFPIKELIDSIITIWNGYEWSEVIPRVTNHVDKLYNIVLSNGMEIKCTEYHKFIMNDNKRVEAKELVIGDKLCKFNYPIIKGYKTLQNSYTYGFFCGDGFYNTEKHHNYIHIYKPKECCLQRMNNINILFRVDDNWKKNFVPNGTYNIESRIEWLAGIIDSDGCINGNNNGVSISSINKDFLLKIQRMLTTLGIYSIVTNEHDENIKDMPGGKYYCQKCYRLIISKYYINKLKDLGLKCNRVDIKSIISLRETTHYPTIVSIDIIHYDDKFPVYCYTDSINNSGCFNGIITANCGEIPLFPYESCNLGHINLSKFVEDDGTFNWELYRIIINRGIIFLDMVIDVNKYPFEEIDIMNRKTRRIGLGVMGFAHALILMNIKYGSDESLNFAGQLAEVLHIESIKASEELGSEFGYYDGWTEGLPERRNVTVNTIAPTGATSLIAETSSSIEPIFSFVYKKTVWNDIDESGAIYIVEPVLEEIIKRENLNREEVIEYIERTGKPHHSIPKKYRDVMITANDISWRDHIEMQSVWQKHIDSSISKTINLPNDATEQDVSDAFITAWVSGCKSITVYRNGSRKIEGLSKDIKDKIESGNRPKILRGITFKGRGGCGNIYTTINGNGVPYECFVRTSGGCEANNEAIGRLISLCLRNNVKLDDIIKQLKTIKCPTAIASKKSEGKSCAGIVGRFLQQYVDDGVTEEIINICPECGERLNFGDGCAKGVCKSCGWSGCS